MTELFFSQLKFIRAPITATVKKLEKHWNCKWQLICHHGNAKILREPLNIVLQIFIRLKDIFAIFLYTISRSNTSTMNHLIWLLLPANWLSRSSISCWWTSSHFQEQKLKNHPSSPLSRWIKCLPESLQHGPPCVTPYWWWMSASSYKLFPSRQSKTWKGIDSTLVTPCKSEKQKATFLFRCTQHKQHDQWNQIQQLRTKFERLRMGPESAAITSNC